MNSVLLKSFGGDPRRRSKAITYDAAEGNLPAPRSSADSPSPLDTGVNVKSDVSLMHVLVSSTAVVSYHILILINLFAGRKGNETYGPYVGF